MGTCSTNHGMRQEEIEKQMDELARQTAKLNSSLAVVGEQYRRQMDALAVKLSEAASLAGSALGKCTSELSKIDWPEVQRRMQQSCEKLANLGWSLPMTFVPGEMFELAEHATTDDDVERYMLEYFTFEDGRFFVELRDMILHSENLVGWRPLLEQCFDAYERKHYLILIPTLLAVIEGVVTECAGMSKSKRIAPRKFATELEKTARPGTMLYLVWRSTRLALERLFQSSDFAGSHPGELNRHWILHGRDQSQWTETDALRLFNLLSTMS
jgi:hypothetical protein